MPSTPTSLPAPPTSAANSPEFLLFLKGMPIESLAAYCAIRKFELLSFDPVLSEYRRTPVQLMRLSQYRAELRRLLHARQDRLPALLEGVTGLLKAQGCAYWGIFPKPTSAEEVIRNPAAYRLFTVASWFRPGQEPGFFGYYNLPLTDTNVGDAVLSQGGISGFDATKRPKDKSQLKHPLRDNKILQSRGVCYVCAAPVYEGDLLTGALSVYRDGPPPPEWFDKDADLAPEKAEAETLEDVALFIPPLFDSVIAAQRMRAIGVVADILREAETSERKKAITEKKAREHLGKLADALADIFRCSEVSIFLQPLDLLSGSSDEFCPLATTWSNIDELKAYRASAEDGITGWVMAHKQPVWIADLRTFEMDKASHQQLFSGIEHKNSLNLDYSKGELPFSFIAAPILLGSTVMGCIRCVSKPDEPRHYTETDATALFHACSLLATAWHRWQTTWEIDHETALWKAFLKQLDVALSECLIKLQTGGSNREKMLKQILSVVPEFVPNAGTASVHLLDPETRHLVQVYPPSNTDNNIDPRFDVDFPKVPRRKPGSLAALTFDSKKVHYFKAVKENRLYAGTIEGDQTNALIICPILLNKAQSEPMGVLSIRSTTTIHDPDFTKHLASTLALQVAIFLGFLDTIHDAQSKTREANIAAEKIKKQEGMLRRVFEDVRHQLKGPLNKAVMQMDSLMRHPRIRNDEDLRKEAAVVKGLCRKAASVARSVKLLADIESGRKVSIKKSPLDADTMFLFLYQMVIDHENESDPNAPVYFSLNREGLDKIPWHKFSADMELLEQVFFCLCDNALKYSYSRTRVSISVRVTGGGKLCFNVANVGTKVTLQESQRILKRGERGWAAQKYRGEGSGIGLFLVEQIAIAHEGSFRIIPTNSEGITIAEFIIP